MSANTKTELAFPSQACGADGMPISEHNHGLTKREYFAAMAMQGIVRRFAAQGDCSTTVALDARDAVRYADALIEALNAEKK